MWRTWGRVRVRLKVRVRSAGWDEGESCARGPGLSVGAGCEGEAHRHTDSRPASRECTCRLTHGKQKRWPHSKVTIASGPSWPAAASDAAGAEQSVRQIAHSKFLSFCAPPSPPSASAPCVVLRVPDIARLSLITRPLPTCSRREGMADGRRCQRDRVEICVELARRWTEWRARRLLVLLTRSLVACCTACCISSDPWLARHARETHELRTWSGGRRRARSGRWRREEARGEEDGRQDGQVRGRIRARVGGRVIGR